MTEQVLFQPRVLVRNRVLLFRLQVKIIRSLLVQKLILCIHQLEPTHFLSTIPTKEPSLCHDEILPLGIVYYFLHKSSLELQVSVKPNQHKPGRKPIKEHLHVPSCGSSLEINFVLRICFREGVEEPYGKAEEKDVEKVFEPHMGIGFALSVIDWNEDLCFEQVLE